jgi:hypothetical protein
MPRDNQNQPSGRRRDDVPQGGLWDIPDEPETYQAAAALPYCNRQRATFALRGQLRLVAGADDAVPDWTTLFIDGPTTSARRHGATWYEWSATVRADTPDD